MTEAVLDEKQNDEDIEGSSASETSYSSDAVDGDTDVDEEIKVKKSEWEGLQKKLQKLDSLEIALKQEREKRQRQGLSEETDKPRKKDAYDDYRKFRDMELRDERIQHELFLKDRFLKKFPSIAADNEYGISTEIVENYRDILEGRIKRGYTPRTRDDVAQIFERAIRIAKPELFAQKKDDLGDEYTGMERGMPEEKQFTQEPRLNDKEAKLRDYVSHRLNKTKRG